MFTARRVLVAVLALSIAVIGSALLFEHVGGYLPCELCLAERWPYYIAIAGTTIVLVAGGRGATLWLGLLALLFLVSAGMGAYHVGVEQHWIAGPTACTGGGASGAKTPEELMKYLQNRQAVQCDEVSWSLFGISLAGWNVVTSLILLALSAAGWRLRSRAP
jgi:disulfide bond formation protein DsbB